MFSSYISHPRTDSQLLQGQAQQLRDHGEAPRPLVWSGLVGKVGEVLSEVHMIVWTKCVKDNQSSDGVS